LELPAELALAHLRRPIWVIKRWVLCARNILVPIKQTRLSFVLVILRWAKAPPGCKDLWRTSGGWARSVWILQQELSPLMRAIEDSGLKRAATNLISSYKTPTIESNPQDNSFKSLPYKWNAHKTFAIEFYLRVL
jgi:hypothetical protein